MHILGQPWTVLSSSLGFVSKHVMRLMLMVRVIHGVAGWVCKCVDISKINHVTDCLRINFITPSPYLTATPLFYNPVLNSSSIDDLGNWCHEKLVWALCKYEAQQGGCHGNPMSGNKPCKRPPIQWKYFSKAVLTQAWLPRLVGRVGSKFASKLGSRKKNCKLIAKQMQVANIADS